MVENPAFIGSIIDVLVGIIHISGGFYRNFDKINQNYLTGIKITKLGREIIEILIISPVQTHKLLILQGINRNFDLFPQKCILKQVVTPSRSTTGEISPTFTKFTYFLSSSKYIIQRVYAIQGVKIHTVKILIVKRLMLKHLNVKSYYFCILPRYQNYCIPPPKHNISEKFKFQYFLTNTINTTAQSKAVCSTIAHLLFYNRCQFSHIFLMVIEQFTLFTAQCCLNNWFEVLSTHVTLLQSLVSQLIGTNKQSIKSS